MTYAPFELERWMTRWELDVDYDIAESGILPLSLNDMTSLLPEDDGDALMADLTTMPLGYSEARGTAALRQIIADTYSRATADDVLVTTGAIEANFLIFNALISPGDHVIAVSPAYQQLLTVPRALGADVSEWSVIHDDGLYYDLDELESLLRTGTRLIVINTPHNPTGALLSDDELDTIVDLAQRSGAWILSDEAYRWIEHPGGERLAPPLHNRYERAVSVGTVSKPFGMPGLRIGWFVANPDIARAAWGMRDYISLSPAKMSDRITQALITHRDRIFERNGRIIAENMRTATDWFAANHDLVSWQPPQAGLLAMMRYSLEMPSSDLANHLAGHARVMLAPGSAFGMEGYLRIGVGQRPDLFAEGLRRTAHVLRELAAWPSGTATARR